jgi:hypothetical protein
MVQAAIPAVQCKGCAQPTTPGLLSGWRQHWRCQEPGRGRACRATSWGPSRCRAVEDADVVGTTCVYVIAAAPPFHVCEFSGLVNSYIGFREDAWFKFEQRSRSRIERVIPAVPVHGGGSVLDVCHTHVFVRCLELCRLPNHDLQRDNPCTEVMQVGVTHIRHHTTCVDMQGMRCSGAPHALHDWAQQRWNGIVSAAALPI